MYEKRRRLISAVNVGSRSFIIKRRIKHTIRMKIRNVTY